MLIVHAVNFGLSRIDLFFEIFLFRSNHLVGCVLKIFVINRPLSRYLVAEIFQVCCEEHICALICCLSVELLAVISSLCRSHLFD